MSTRPTLPADLDARYEAWAAASLAGWLPRDAPHFAQTLAWVTSRFRAGQAFGERLRTLLPKGPVRMLDLGAGNGGVSAGFASLEGFSVVALDYQLNGEVVEIRRSLQVDFDYLVANGAALPFRASSFDAVALIDVVEHVSEVRTLGREVARVVRPGGVAIVTTPPRARFLFRGDPHDGIPYLALLPRLGQRIVAERILKRTSRYDVERLYMTARGVGRIFPRGAFAFRVQGSQGPLARIGLDWEGVIGRRSAT